MWNISYYLNLTLTGRHESICASMYRNNPDSWVVTILNMVFSCHKNHCQKAYNYWERKNGKR